MNTLYKPMFHIAEANGHSKFSYLIYEGASSWSSSPPSKKSTSGAWYLCNGVARAIMLFFRDISIQSWWQWFLLHGLALRSNVNHSQSLAMKIADIALNNCWGNITVDEIFKVAFIFISWRILATWAMYPASKSWWIGLISICVVAGKLSQRRWSWLYSPVIVDSAWDCSNLITFQQD